METDGRFVKCRIWPGVIHDRLSPVVIGSTRIANVTKDGKTQREEVREESETTYGEYVHRCRCMGGISMGAIA